MFTLDLRVDHEVQKAIAQLDTVSTRQWPFIFQVALNNTAADVLKTFQTAMPYFIDRPTPFTVNSMFVKQSTKQKLEATIQWKEFTGTGSIPAGKYLTPEVYGGARKQKRFEKALQAAGLIPSGWVAVPTKDAPIDSYGNVPGGYITQILSYLGANPDFQANRSVKKLRRMSTASIIKGIAKALLDQEREAKDSRQRARRQKFFAVIKGRNGNPLPSGIYERVNMSLGSAIKRVFDFVPVATYKVSFPFFDIGTGAANAAFPVRLTEAIQKAIATTDHSKG